MPNLNLRSGGDGVVQVDDVQLDKCIRLINSMDSHNKTIVKMRFGDSGQTFAEVEQLTGLSYYLIKRRIEGIVSVIVEKCVKPYTIY